MGFYQNEKSIFHFEMIGDIINFISFCVDSMMSVLESVVFEAFQISAFLLLSFKSA